MKAKFLKKAVSVVLAVTMLAVLCVPGVFAAEAKYPPLETQDMCDTRIFDGYMFTVAGRDCEPGGLDDVPMLNAEAKPLDDETVNQIIDDWGYTGTDYEYTAKDVTYYGTLSDGSMLVKVNELFYFTALNYMVIGKYVYVTPNIGDEVRIYKDRKFERIITAYQDGELSDELLDEVAQTLHFAEFVNPGSSEEPSTPDEPVTQPPVTEPSTPDEPVTQPPKPTEPATDPELEIMPEPADGEYTLDPVMGDVDGDGKLSILDASGIQLYLAGLKPLDEARIPVADADGDGGLSIKDAAHIQLSLAGLL